MKLFAQLNEEMEQVRATQRKLHEEKKGDWSFAYYYYQGYRKNLAANPATFRGNGVHALFTLPELIILKSEMFAGNRFCNFVQQDERAIQHANEQYNFFGYRGFATNSDHYAPNYRHTLAVGVPGLIAEVDASLEKHKDDADKVETLQSMKHVLEGFRQMIRNYAKKAAECKQDPAYNADRLDFIIENCNAIAEHKPESFAQALQLVWLCHAAFLMEGRYAMALGRLDQYLYPFYKADIDAGRITNDQVIEYLENIFIRLQGDVVNICIGGKNVKGECEVNELSRCILRAVDNCHVPGPNLSFRVTDNTPDEFLDECLKVIGTGLGYPALMNNEVNVAALKRYGYKDEDACDYSMVGCIENFITGKQPPWSDGRFDPPLYFDFLFNHGFSQTRHEKGSWISGCIGLDTGDVEDIDSMDEFMARFEKQLDYGITEYCARFNKNNNYINQAYLPQPFLSCFCEDCIGRGLDINNGGAIYPSVHGAALMGIGTTSDSLAAIEKVVFIDKEATLVQLRDALNANFEGYEWLQEKLLAAPKYGNNDDFVDKYAIWFVDFLDSCLAKHRTRDGGWFYGATASNTSNIPAGETINATPDGRKRGEPLSDAASPTYGRDTRGATASINSLCKPDYTKIGCGTVVNQKYSPSMFSDEKRGKLLALIRTYFKKGGQEIQINSTSRAILMDAMEHPENYKNLVVRVSGFSAFYVTLDKRVQRDILNRTQHE